MKLAFFTNSYLPYLSGITLSIQTLSKELQKLGHTIYIICPKYPGNIEIRNSCLPAGTAKFEFIFRLPSLPSTYPGYRLVVPYSYSIFKKLKQAKIDIIHAHQPFGVGLAALLLAKRMQIPFVYTLHTLFPRYVHHVPFLPKAPLKRLISAYLMFFCDQADTVIVPSEMVRRWLVINRVTSRIEVIPTGVSTEEAVSAKKEAVSREALFLPADAKVLLFVGRISEEKNIRFLLDAFPEIVRQEPKAYLVLVGGGPAEAKYRRLAREKSSRILFTGQKSHQEVLSYYGVSDLFVFASTTETQGLVISEAKAQGLPVVAVFGGGLVDVVENGIDGYLLPRSCEKFAQHVLRLLKDNALRREMGRRAQADARERCSSAAVAKRMESVYNSLKQKRGA